MKRKLSYALSGAALGVGAPLGWLLLQGAGAQPERAASLVAASPGLYGYLLGGTTVALAGFGIALGQLSDRLEALARTDALTGLANVRAFEERLAQETARVERTGQPLAMVMVDLDRFKLVNDRFGHGVGDEVLRHAAKVLSRSVRAVDFVARVGGEELAIVCPGANSQDAVQIAERARAALDAEPVHTSAGDVLVTASFGVALLEAGPSQLRQRADAALYEAKGAGRNRVVAA